MNKSEIRIRKALAAKLIHFNSHEPEQCDLTARLWALAFFGISTIKGVSLDHHHKAQAIFHPCSEGRN